MQPTDLHFLDNLQQKLAIGNRPSIYLHALPEQHSASIDAAQLDGLTSDLSNQFIQLLLSRPNFDCTISVGNTPNGTQQHLLHKLHNIAIENKDHLEEHGRSTFGFGFPILLMRDPIDSSKIIQAPLFIWSLDLVRNLGHAEQWHIKRSEDFGVVPNPVLDAYVLRQAKIQLPPISDQLLEDWIIDKEELVQLVFDQLQQLVPTLAATIKTTFRAALDQPILALPSAAKTVAMSLEAPTVLWSGILGLFPPSKRAILKDIASFSANLDKLNTQITQVQDALPKGDSAYMKHAVSLLETDPSQQKVLHLLDQGKNVLIEGAPGSGKSKTLAGVIANTISNAGTCLVVCNKKTALNDIYKELQELGLSELAVVIEDTHRDRTKVVDSVRARAKQQHATYQPSPTFIRLLRSCTNHVQQLQQYHEQMHVPLSGDATFSNLVGQLLANNKMEDITPIGDRINARQFKFTPTEYQAVKSVLSESEYLFKKLGTMQHPLNALEDHFFQQVNVVQVEKNIHESLQNLSKVVQSAQRDMLTYLYEYENLLEQHYEDIYLKKLALTSKATDIIEGGLSDSKYYFNTNKGFYRGLLKSVSDKYKKLDQDKATVLQIYIEIQKLHARYRYFDFKFEDISDHNNLIFEKLHKNIEAYQSQVYEWHESRGPVIRDLVNELSPSNIYKHINFNTKVQEVTQHLDVFERNFAKSDVFKVRFKFVSSQIRKRHKQLEGLEVNLKKLQAKFENFGDYHALKYFWLSLTNAQRAVIEQLIEINPPDWQKSFESWYLNALLKQHQEGNIPDEASYTLARSSYVQELALFQKMLVPHTLQYWRGEQTRQVQKFHTKQAPRTLYDLYNKRNNGVRRNSLRTMVGVAPRLFQCFFPVVLVSPNVCSAILPLKAGLFDLVLFDEASQLRIEDTFCAAIRGKYQLVAGDSQQMPPIDYFQEIPAFEKKIKPRKEDIWATASFEQDSLDYLASSESLLELSLAKGEFETTALQVHYRSEHPYLFDFSNAAFYANRLQYCCDTPNTTPITVVAVNGIYSQHTNEQEATAIVNYLVDWAKTQPSKNTIGVATLNSYQRNLILQKIQERATQQPEDGVALEQLFQQGLFVKSIENLQGEERDTMLLSTTFGVDEAGNFLQQFGSINQENGYRLLNVWITRAKQNIRLFTSIPPAYYQNYKLDILKTGNRGKGIFYAYLAYANAVANQDDSTRQAILDLLEEYATTKHSTAFPVLAQAASFEQHIVDFLEQKLSNYTLVANYNYDGFVLPLAILDADQKLQVALYYDTMTQHNGAAAYAWEIYTKNYLQAKQIASLRVWSSEWWQDQQQAAQKLLAQLEQALN